MTTETEKKPTLRLSGQDGNVFNLLGLARRAAREAGWAPDRWQAVREEAMGSGSYDGVIQTFMRHFDVE